MNILNSQIAKDALAYCAYLVFFSIIYITSLTTIYGFSDDYAYIASAHTQLPDLMSMMTQGGRPVYAVLSCIYIGVTNVSDLCWIRLFSLAGIAALSTLFMKHLKENSPFSSSVCIVFAACIGLMPAFQVYAAWSVTAGYTWAAFMAGLSYRLVQHNPKQQWQRLFFSFLLLGLAICTYQPSAMMYWVFAGTAWLASDKPLPALKVLLTTCAVMAGALILDFIATKALPSLVFHAIPPMNRTALVSDIGGKITWFLLKALRNALDLPYAKGSTLLSILVLIFIVSGFVVHYRARQYFKYQKVLICIFLVPLSYLPNLVVQENWAAYRTQSALTSLLLLYFTIALWSWLKTIKASQYMTPCMSVLLILCAWIAHSDVKNGFAKPQSTELRLTTQYLSKINNFDNAASIYFVLARREETLAPFLRYDEFGLPSSSQMWLPKSLIWVLLNARHSPNLAKVSIAGVGYATDIPNSGNVTVFNFGDILQQAHSQ
ncbi:hypothetical protein JK165_05250 [Acetobacter okinawensis]|uniref:glucosyltransferase domain-containing protein n=1 Tax=Acetobacter okinawensis TaxID=1076594 RepID=UPI001BA82D9C|nr:hypothetical protein [Acetobacter okinawensis]